MKKINYLGFLSLLSLISLLAFMSDNKGLFGFFGFLYYVRYFWVIPDELFLLNVRESANIAFFAEMLSLIPFMFISIFIFDLDQAVPISFGLSFAISIITFSFALVYYEWKERKVAQYD